MSFYKKDETSGELLHGPNFVLNAEYELRAESHGEHEYPVDGWWWFDSEEQAREALGVSAPEPEPEPEPWLAPPVLPLP